MLSLHSITCPPQDMPDVISLLDTANYEKLDEVTKLICHNPAYITRITDLVRDMVKMNYL